MPHKLMLSFFDTTKTTRRTTSRTSTPTSVPFLTSLITAHHYKTLNYFSTSPDSENVIIHTHDEGDLVIVRTVVKDQQQQSTTTTPRPQTSSSSARRMATLTAPYNNAMRIGEFFFPPAIRRVGCLFVGRHMLIRYGYFRSRVSPKSSPLRGRGGRGIHFPALPRIFGAFVCKERRFANSGFGSFNSCLQKICIDNAVTLETAKQVEHGGKSDGKRPGSSASSTNVEGGVGHQRQVCWIGYWIG